MKSTIKKVALGIVACALLLTAGYQSLLLVNEYTVRAKVKQLLFTTNMYHAEHKKYPKTLNDMVDANFLSEATIQALTGGLRFQYEPPNGDDISSDKPIFTAKLGRLVVLGHPSGKIESTRK